MRSELPWVKSFKKTRYPKGVIADRSARPEIRK